MRGGVGSVRILEGGVDLTPAVLLITPVTALMVLLLEHVRQVSFVPKIQALQTKVSCFNHHIKAAL